MISEATGGETGMRAGVIRPIEDSDHTSSRARKLLKQTVILLIGSNALGYGELPGNRGPGNCAPAHHAASLTNRPGVSQGVPVVKGHCRRRSSSPCLPPFALAPCRKGDCLMPSRVNRHSLSPVAPLPLAEQACAMP
jgi:hypothetical protein